MVNKQLADWIKSEEAQGYSEKQLRDYLLKQGYKPKDIEEAVNSLKIVDKPSSKFSSREVFKPTPLKLFFPLLFLLLIIISFFINSAHIPPVGEFFCNTLDDAEERRELSENLRDKSLENNANAQELINLYQQEEDLMKRTMSSRNVLAEHLKPLITGNLYFTFSMVYKLNPLFPTPCEALTLEEGFSNTNFCRYYMSEEDFNCINNHIEKQKQEAGGAGMIGLFNDDLPPYKNQSFIMFLIHSFILVIILYTILSLIGFARIKVTEQEKKKKWLINGILIILPIIIAFMFRIELILFSLPLIIIFVISSLIRNEKHNKVFLYVLTSILIVLLIAGVFITNFIVDRNVIATSMDSSITSRSMEYKVFECENTKLLSTEEIQQFGFDETYVNQEWNVCDNPTCSEMCSDYCNQNQYGSRRIAMLRGDSPSCICGC